MVLRFTAQSPRIAGILMSADCSLGAVVCQVRGQRDRSRFVFPQQVWEDLYGQPWRVACAGEPWYQNLIKLGYITGGEPTDGKRTRTLRSSRKPDRKRR